MHDQKVPIAFFTYNRPAHTRLSLKALRRCDRIDECRVYAFSDGPKTQNDVEKVRETRAVLKESLPEDALIVSSDKNMGLAMSIINGVSFLCRKFGRVIVVEDDLIVTNNFIAYMLDSLERYAAHVNVFQVSGYMHNVRLNVEKDALFMPYTTTWGWATWDRAWNALIRDPFQALNCLRSAGVRNKFDLDNSCTYSKMLEERCKGRNDSWGILWWLSVFKQKGLVLHPKVSKVHSIGFDGTGRHSKKAHFVQQLEFDEVLNTHYKAIFSFPTEVKIDQKNFERVIRYFRRTNKKRCPNVIGRIFSMFRKLLSREIS